MPTFQILEAEMAMQARDSLVAETHDEAERSAGFEPEASVPGALGSTSSARALGRWLHRVMMPTH